MPRQVLTEATTQATATPVPGAPGRFMVQLISPGWGSSGYYGVDVLEAAGKAKVFPAGLHMYLDHPTATETYDRPERSVRDLAAVLNEDATWNGEALVGEATVFGSYREVLEQMSDSIGVSIRAAAEVAPGEAEGRHGLIIGELIEGVSADFVTHAGRGGKILQVLESARQVAEARNIGQWIESRIHRDFTVTADDMAGDGRLTREERITLSGAIGDALAAFVTRLEGDAPQLYTRDLWDDPQDTIAAAIEAAKNVPDLPAGQSTTQESEEDTMPNIQVDEAQHAALVERAGRVETLESERDTAIRERDEAREANAVRDRADVVQRVLGDAVEAAGIELNPFERDGITSRAVVTDGTVDEAATRTAFDTALATLAEANGRGRPRGLGGPIRTGEEGDSVSEADFDALDDAIFGTIKEA